MNPRYKIVSELGKGGTSVVYKANDLMLNRMVALKVLNDSLARDPAAVQRLRREGQTLCTLQHPNIVQLFSFEVHEDGVPVMIMDVAEGISLSKLLQQNGPLAEAAALRMFKQICSGLSYAHDLKVVHRDIKPSNILSTADGGIKILDFGIAKFGVDWSEELQAITQSGQLFGTPAYMSPEQLNGSSEIDRRSDIYSLGCSMYEMVSGHLPFQGENALEIAQRSLHDEIQKITTISSGLEAIIRRCMQRDPSIRFQNCDEIIEALDNLERTKDTKAEPKKSHQIAAVAISLALLAFGFHHIDNQRQQEIATKQGAQWDEYLQDLESKTRAMWKQSVFRAEELADQRGFRDERSIHTYLAHSERILQHPGSADYETADTTSAKALALLNERNKHHLPTSINFKIRIYKARGDIAFHKNLLSEAVQHYEKALLMSLPNNQDGLVEQIAKPLIEAYLQEADASSALKVFQTVHDHKWDSSGLGKSIHIELDYTDPDLPRLLRAKFQLADELKKSGLTEAWRNFSERLQAQNQLLPDGVKYK